jgi:hypothetical protein
MKLTGKLLKEMIQAEMYNLEKEDMQRSYEMVQTSDGMVQEVPMEEFERLKASPDYVDVTNKLPEAGNMLIHVSNIPIPRGSAGDIVNE